MIDSVNLETKRIWKQKSYNEKYDIFVLKVPFNVFRFLWNNIFFNVGFHLFSKNIHLFSKNSRNLEDKDKCESVTNIFVAGVLKSVSKGNEHVKGWMIGTCKNVMILNKWN